MSYFNPRAPQGARRFTALLRCHWEVFQSTRSAGSATPFFGLDDLLHFISIHALRRERDCLQGFVPVGDCNFNPRAPQGARRRPARKITTWTYFNPRAPQGARRSTASPCRRCRDFNPRAPQGARQYTDHTFCFVCEFQSTRSAGSATAKVDIKGLFCDASITIIRHICVFS